MGDFKVTTPISQRLLIIVALATLVVSSLVNVVLLLGLRNQTPPPSITVYNNTKGE